jgi:hypothetical protein
MDNAAENVSLKSNLEKEGLPVEVEFTSPNTPEQNGQVERSFATLWGRVRAMLNNSGVEKDFRNELWAECASTATKLSNLIVRTKEGSPFELFYGRKPKVGKNLRIFGEIGIKITRAQVHHEKLNNKGNECIFVGYEDNHPQDAYRVFDLKNKTIMITRNVRWLGQTFGEYFMLEMENYKVSDWRRRNIFGILR